MDHRIRCSRIVQKLIKKADKTMTVTVDHEKKIVNAFQRIGVITAKINIREDFWGEN